MKPENMDSELRSGEHFIFTLFAVEIALAAVCIILAFIGSWL